MSLLNTSTIIELTRNHDRDEMLEKMLASDTEYQVSSERFSDILKTLMSKAPDGEYKELLFDLEAAASFTETQARELAYEKGVKDGTQHILSVLIDNSGAV